MDDKSRHLPSVRDAVYRLFIISSIFRLCLFDIDIHSATDEIPSIIDVSSEGPFKTFIFLFSIQCAELMPFASFTSIAFACLISKYARIQEFTSLYFEAHFILLRLRGIKHLPFIYIVTEASVETRAPIPKAFRMVSIHHGNLA